MVSRFHDDYKRLISHKETLFDAIETKKCIILNHEFTCLPVLELLIQYSTFQNIQVIENSQFALNLIKKNLSLENDKQIDFLSSETYFWKLASKAGNMKRYPITIVTVSSFHSIISSVIIKSLLDNMNDTQKLIIIKNYETNLEPCLAAMKTDQVVHLNFVEKIPSNCYFCNIDSNSYETDIMGLIKNILQTRGSLISKRIVVFLPSKKSIKQFATDLDDLTDIFDKRTIVNEIDLLNLKFPNETTIILVLNDANLLNSLFYLDYLKSFDFTATIQSCISSSPHLNPYGYTSANQTNKVARKLMRSQISASSYILMTESSFNKLPLDTPFNFDMLGLLLILFRKHQGTPWTLYDDPLLKQFATFEQFEISLVQLEILDFIRFSSDKKDYIMPDRMFHKICESSIEFNFFDRRWINLTIAWECSMTEIPEMSSFQVSYFLLGLISLIKALDESRYSIWSLLYDLNSTFKKYFRSIESDFITLINFFQYSFDYNDKKLTRRAASKDDLLYKSVNKLFSTHKILNKIPAIFNTLAHYLPRPVSSDVLEPEQVTDQLLYCLRKGFVFNVGICSQLKASSTKQPLIRFRVDSITTQHIPQLTFQVPEELVLSFKPSLVHWFQLINDGEEDYFPFLGLSGKAGEIKETLQGYFET
ncbi:hypothetical protein CANARDRAFT_54636 [[Candida] arabinofermentans NRRL YB-2248]|uniref:Uncharacterized protein n=1 Tax=[Candida] arabinofermentans NRRL YB-2248 TaxID=983967 RepID=A0A1E4T858_9ASCO|nr:hypothetical protein CANARDRAFT_54636 [[Candida] arabinofermentans NRRL YB-2248]